MLPLLIHALAIPADYFVSIYAGGYNGAKEGYEIPTGTDIFVSVSEAIAVSKWFV